MKTKLIAALILGSVLLAATPPAATAADHSALIASVAKWESGQDIQPLFQLEELVREAVGNRKSRAELELALLKLLAPDCTFEARRFACQQLAIIGSDASVPALANLLQNNDTIGLACLAFGNRPSTRADTALRNALPDAAGQGRLQIISTLGNRRDAKAVIPLAILARDADSLVALTAIQALGKIANAPARKTLTALEGQLKPELQITLADALLRCADELVKSGSRKVAAAVYEPLTAQSQPAFIRRGAFAGLLRCERDGGEQRILETLRGNDAVLKPVAIVAIRELPSKGASERLGRELPGLTPMEQVWLIESLAARNDAAARVAVASALSASAESNVRQAAAQALGQIGDASVIGKLTQALAAAKDEAEVNALVAALAIVPGGHATDTAVLNELNAAQGKVRAQLISSLANRRSAEVLTALLNETGHPDPIVARAAFRVMSRAGAEDPLPLLVNRFAVIRDAELRADVEGFVEQAVAGTENVATRTSAVRGALRQATEVEARAALLTLLPACGDAAALETLNEAANDADARVRAAAVRALAEWPDASAWNALAAVWRNPESDSHRLLSLRGLTRMAGDANARPDAALIGRYRDLLDGARNDDERKLILSALGGAAHLDALNLALPLLDVPGVRAEAEVAVKKIAGAIKNQHPDAAKAALERASK
ncbi:MAG: HEAT repeat domain-containing protein [Verrucomicrobiae bacterium]|nr:HEAT repeat domain-containing protein [Verrucomicrobiae bacterium]